MRGRYAIILLFPLLLFSYYTSAVQAANFNVNSASALISAINTANSNNANDTITLTADITLTVVNNTNEEYTDDHNGLPIITGDNSHSLTIHGNGFTIRRDASAPNFRIFHMGEDADVILNNLTVTGGQQTGTGAGIFNEGLLTINSVNVIDNQINAEFSGFGAGILNTGTMTINDSTISGNRITTTLIGGSSMGAGIANYEASIYINNSLIDDNSIDNGYGHAGGIYTDGVDSYLTVYESTISNNSVPGGGAAIGSGLTRPYEDGIYTGSVTEIQYSTISNNVAGGFGNGIYHIGGSLTFYMSTASGNYSTGPEGNSFSVIVMGAGDLTIDSSTITNNEVGVITEDADVTIRKSLIAGNYGGAVYAAYDCTNTNPTSLDIDNYNVFGEATHPEHCQAGSTNIVFPADGDPASLVFPLANNGGETQTHALVPGSLAINVAAGCGTRDQRGFPRPVGGLCDAGAYEADGTETAPDQEGPIFTVNTTDNVNDGDCTILHCSLVEAIGAANDFADSVPMVSIPAGTYEFNGFGDLENDMSIVGAGIGETILEANGGDFFEIRPNSAVENILISDLSINNPGTIFEVRNPLNLTVTNIAVTGSVESIYMDTISANGGVVNFNNLQVDGISTTSAIYPLFRISGSILHLRNSFIVNSDIYTLFEIAGGAPEVHQINNTTISGNTFGTIPDPYAIEIVGNTESILEFSHVTIAGNENFGFKVSGIAYMGVIIQDSIFADNTVEGSPNDCAIETNSRVYQFEFNNSIVENNNCLSYLGNYGEPIEVDPLLLALADNGGGTLTHALSENSPAINAIPLEECNVDLPFDQRGEPRPMSDGCDIGAFESVYDTPVDPTDTPTPEVTPEVTPTETVTPEITPEITPEVTPTETVTPEITPEVTPEITPEVTPTETVTPEITPEITPEVTPTETVTPEITPEVTQTETVTPEITPEITPEVTQTETVTPEITPEITPEVTPTETVTPEITPEITPEVTPTETVTPEITPEITQEVTPTDTVTPEITPEVTPEITQELTETPDPTEPPVVTEEWIDSDGDNYPNNEDACPWQGNEGGLGVDETGCPYYDADWDGFYDRDDACPWQGNEGGLGVDETGCPYYDADWDGFTDREDACPWRGNEYGLGVDNTGCPVESSGDEPYVTQEPGVTEEWSDPDYDGDGFINAIDSCPWQGNEGGLGVDETGCPYYDADWDGFYDRNDECPWQGNEGGLGVDEVGCPYYDADWDGVYDRNDSCVWRGNEYGLGVDESGCPISANFDENGYMTEEPYVTVEP